MIIGGMKQGVCVFFAAVTVLAAGISCTPRQVAPRPAPEADPGTEGMILIPGGTFIRGGPGGDNDEQPAREVSVETFFMDAHEVTVGQYRIFLAATGYPPPAFWHPDLDRSDDPVVGVTWFDAAAYASWAGKRLPTEAEWEYAARGAAQDPAVPGGGAAGQQTANIESFCIVPVKSFAANGYGLYDMTGNVWEWCADWYDSTYYTACSRTNPQGPVGGTHKVLRGGAWYCRPREARTANRYYSVPDAESFHIGFRCARSVR